MSDDDIRLYDDEAEHRRAVLYSRIREWLTLVGMVWSLATTLLLLSTGLSARIRNVARDITPARLDPVIPYIAMFSLVTYLTSLPLSWVSGFFVEHRFGLSNQSLRDWLIESLKGLGLSVVITSLLGEGAYWVIKRYPRRWWAILSGLTVPVSVLFGALAPVLIMPLFNKYEPLRNRDLAERLERLAAEQGVQVSDVMQMDMSKQTRKANAMFTGIGRTKRIVLGDTMLDEFAPDEVEVVIAHELGHQVHRDIWKLVALSAPLSAISLLTAFRVLPEAIHRFGKQWGLNESEGAADVAALPLLTLIAGLPITLLTPALNALIRSQVEHPADVYAIELTHSPSAFIAAMIKLGRMNLSNPKPSAIVKWMLYDHPTIAERIAYARSREGTTGQQT